MAVTVTYEWPIAGAVAPTALQAMDKVVATVIATQDADVLATITHNIGLSVAELAAGFSEVLIEQLLPQGWVSTPHVLAGGKTTNAVAVTMSNAGGSGVAGAQFRVSISRPHSIGK